jgi:hypothetical protein
MQLYYKLLIWTLRKPSQQVGVQDKQVSHTRQMQMLGQRVLVLRCGDPGEEPLTGHHSQPQPSPIANLTTTPYLSGAGWVRSLTFRTTSRLTVSIGGLQSETPMEGCTRQEATPPPSYRSPSLI